MLTLLKLFWFFWDLALSLIFLVATAVFAFSGYDLGLVLGAFVLSIICGVFGYSQYYKKVLESQRQRNFEEDF